MDDFKADNENFLRSTLRLLENHIITSQFDDYFKRTFS
jgi:hypothetical protein